MSSCFNLLCVSFLVLFSLYSVSGLMCWTCDSLHDSKCSDPFNNHSMPMVDCKQVRLDTYPNLRGTMCRKIRQKVYGKWRYYRSCAFLGEPGIGNDERYCLMRTGTNNIFTEYCTCNTRDGCNSASLMSISLFSFLPVTTLFYFKRLL
ncbi:uncharacterized protein LOC126893517 [Daktulosphaira vitifoliae]|uniref:uncharacterized protein LOC126893517 n=1 Tax=Daktulosphaira vitifoliae TaxID=58002 RepID=UPI0021A9D5C5|nr:uncharacterized protein LOC126893517 [Daktulosphaira vitifoliae]